MCKNKSFSMHLLPMNSPEWGDPGKHPKKIFQLGEGNDSVSLCSKGMLKPFVPCMLTKHFSVSGSRLVPLFLTLFSSPDKECTHPFGYQKALFPTAPYPAPSPPPPLAYQLLSCHCSNVAMSFLLGGFHLPHFSRQTLSPARPANKTKRLGLGTKGAEVEA